MVINEACAKLYGYTNPADAVGKNLTSGEKEPLSSGERFNFRSLHQAVEPLTLRYGYPYNLNRMPFPPEAMCRQP
jgi:putative ABC transport system permease protein